MNAGTAGRIAAFAVPAAGMRLAQAHFGMERDGVRNEAWFFDEFKIIGIQGEPIGSANLPNLVAVAALAATAALVRGRSEALLVTGGLVAGAVPGFVPRPVSAFLNPLQDPAEAAASVQRRNDEARAEIGTLQGTLDRVDADPLHFAVEELFER